MDPHGFQAIALSGYLEVVLGIPPRNISDPQVEVQNMLELAAPFLDFGLRETNNESSTTLSVPLRANSSQVFYSNMMN